MRSITPHQHAILSAAAKSTGRLQYLDKFTPRLWLSLVSKLVQRDLAARIGPAAFITEHGRVTLANAKVKAHADDTRRGKWRSKVFSANRASSCTPAMAPVDRTS